MPLAEDQNMIQALAPDCADQALNIWNSARATSVRSGGHAADQRDERAAPDHSITSSARARTGAGTSRPSAFAVFRLTTRSYPVGACTGRSAGLAPFRMRST